jgi:hypothetical protein
MEEFLAKVALMRRLQKEYFKERNILTLRACKKVEREVDAFLSIGAKGPSSPKQGNGPLQPSLF